jgi:phosphoribosylanthranilate isomerase
LPPFVTTVGLFVNASRCELNEILEAVPLDLLQFHGDESPADCEGYHRPGSRPCVSPGDDLEAACKHYAGARGILLDTYVACPGEPAKRSTGH